MKRISVLLIAFLLICSFSFLTSCSDDVSSVVSGGTSLVKANFTDDSKGLNSSVEDFKGASEYYWFYTAKSNSKSSAVGTTEEETPVKEGEKGLGVVEGFEVGNWSFKLFAYDDAERSVIKYESAEVKADLKPNQTTQVSFPVKKAQLAGQKGTLTIDVANITFKDKGNGEHYQLDNVEVYASDGSLAHTFTSNADNVGFSAELEPDTYSLILNFVDVLGEDEALNMDYTCLAYINGVRVYSNTETKVSGEVEGKIANSFPIYYFDKGEVPYSGQNRASLPAKHVLAFETLVPNGARNFYNFDGWFTDPSCESRLTQRDGQYYIDSVLNIDYRIPLYAVWIPITYTIEYDYNALEDGKDDVTLIKGETHPEKYDVTSPTINISNPARTGYEFISWTSGTDDTTSYSSLELPTGTAGDLSFTANWREFTYNVHFDSNLVSATNATLADLSGEMEDLEDVLYSEKRTIPENAFDIKGWKFVAWVRADNGVRLPGGMTADDPAIAYKLTSVDKSTVTLKALWEEKGDVHYEFEHYFENLEGVKTDLSNYVINNDYTQKFDDGKTNSAKSATAKTSLTGYTYDAEISKATSSGIVKGDGTLVLKLYYPRNVWSLDYNFNGGETSDDFTTAGDYKWDKPIVIPSDGSMSKVGYTFTGWSIDNGKTTTSDLPEKMPDNHLVLTATWSKNKYRVEYNALAPSGASTSITGSMSEQEFTYDDDAKPLNTMIYGLEGYHFVNWKRTDITTATTFTDAQKVRNLTSDYNGLVKLETVWEANKYKAIFASNSDYPVNASTVPTGTMAEQDWTFDEPVKKVSDNEFERVGYSFKSWNTEANGSGTEYLTSTNVNNLSSKKDITLYAQWVAKDYYLIFDSNKPAITQSVVNGSMDNQKLTFDAESKINDCKFKIEGYTFKGWSTDSNATYQDTDKIYNTTTNYVNLSKEAENVTLYAVWKANEYKIHFDGNENGNSRHKSRSSVTNTMADQDRVYDEDKSLATSKLPECGFERTGYTFKGWSTDSNADPAGSLYTTTTGYNNFSSGSDVTMYAIWDINRYKVTVMAKYVDVDEEGNRSDSAAKFGLVNNLEETSFTHVDYKAKVSFTNFDVYIINTDDGEKRITSVPDTSTSDYAYYFDGYTDFSSSPAGLSVEDDNLIVYAVFVRKLQPKVTPSGKMPTNITVDYKSGNLEDYKKATYGSYNTEVSYGSSKLDATVFTVSSLAGHSIEGLYLDKGLTIKLVNADGTFVASTEDLTDANAKWVKSGGTVPLYAKWKNN